MPTLYLVRHGRAAAGWDADADPGLDAVGRHQAEGAAELLAPRGPLALVSSPMLRTRETAAPLAARWKCEPRIEPRVSEIPSPTDDLAARGAWLKEVAARRWGELDAELQAWRDRLCEALLAMTEDTVVTTHFIAINAAVGAACGDDRVVHFRPDHCSVSVLRVEDGRLRLVEQGREAQTQVL